MNAHFSDDPQVIVVEVSQSNGSGLCGMLMRFAWACGGGCVLRSRRQMPAAAE